MSYIIIGDVHGTAYWKDIVKEHKQKDEDIVIFLGDYLDSFTIKPKQCLSNLKELFEYRRNTPNTYMLVGNHDYHYMGHDADMYAGFKASYADLYKEVIFENYALLDMIAVITPEKKPIICSHAGVSSVFLEKEKTTVENLNNLWRSNPQAFGFIYGTGDNYGNHPSQSPLWIRPQSLVPYAVKGYNQIVGHTNYKTIVNMYANEGQDEITIVCTEDSNGFIVIH